MKGKCKVHDKSGLYPPPPPLDGVTPSLSPSTPLHKGVEKNTVIFKCLAEEHHVLTMGRAQTLTTARSWDQAPVVQRVCNTIYRIDYYAVDRVVCFANSNPLDIVIVLAPVVQRLVNNNQWITVNKTNQVIRWIVILVLQAFVFLVIE